MDFFSDYSMTIGGKAVAGATVFDVINPATEQWTCNGFVPVTYLIMPPWLRRRAG
ncbi:MAG: hypothetical protein AB7E55_23800 [Pigmentiphaga sp.]